MKRKINSINCGKLLTKADVAELLGVSKCQVGRLCKMGNLRYIKLGHKTVRFRQQDIEKNLEKLAIVGALKREFSR